MSDLRWFDTVPRELAPPCRGVPVVALMDNGSTVTGISTGLSVIEQFPSLPTPALGRMAIWRLDLRESLAVGYAFVYIQLKSGAEYLYEHDLWTALERHLRGLTTDKDRLAIATVYARTYAAQLEA